MCGYDNFGNCEDVCRPQKSLGRWGEEIDRGEITAVTPAMIFMQQTAMASLAPVEHSTYTATTYQQ